MERLEAGIFNSLEGSQIGRISLGPANMGVRRMYICRKESDDGECLCLSNYVFRPQVEPFAEVGQNSGVSASGSPLSRRNTGNVQRIDFEVGLCALLAPGELLLRLILLAALL